MNSTDLTVGSEDRLDTESIVIISSAVAFVFGLAIFLFRKKLTEVPETDPPPIIIKSGSFILETENDFDTVSSGNTPPFTFKKNAFAIRKIRVNIYNEISGRSFFQDFSNSEVRIWLEYFNTATNQWNGISANPDIKIKGASADFELSINIGKKLKLMKKSHKKRKNKYEDEEHPKVFRFGRIEIGGSLPIIPSEGDEYLMGFYKT